MFGRVLNTLLLCNCLLKNTDFQIVVSGNHFVKNLFPGLDQVPSPFAVGTICCICFSQDQLLTSGNLFFTKIKITTRLK